MRTNTPYANLINVYIKRLTNTSPWSVPISQSMTTAIYGNLGQVISLPIMVDNTSTQLQDFNPTSPTFGQFYGMVGFDGLG